MTAPDRVAELRAAQAEVDAEVLAPGFPTYEVPAFVAERFPGFSPADPSTWPEPDKCTEGRPWGHSAYSYAAGDAAGRWQQYLAQLDRPVRRPTACRNRWKHEDSRLCGVHDRPWRDNRIRSIRRQAARARELRHLDLAKQLAAYGIAADGTAAAVTLTGDAAVSLLALLAQTGCVRCGRLVRPGERHLVIVGQTGPDDSPEPEYECLDEGDLPLPFAPPAETQTEPDPF